MPANIAPATSPAASTGSASSRPLQPLQTRATSPTTPTTPNAATLTQKQWTVPPRPKPGRKPATDTPATKRKAQNRVAQRAFRERKAAKIGELEEQIEEIGKDHAAEMAALQTQLASLMDRLNQQHPSQDATSPQADVERWRMAYLDEKRLRENLEREVAILKGEAVSLPRRNYHQSYNTPEDIPLGCSKCSLTHCQCLEDALEDNFTTKPQEGLIKRPSSPPQVDTTKIKKIKSSPTLPDTSAEELHVDAPHGAASMLDGCGFCTEGTTCVCAELAADMNATQRHDINDSSNLPSPPSEEVPLEIDFTHTTKPTSSCPDGPGSCNACQRDPERALFCKTLAASRDSPQTVATLSTRALGPEPAPCPAGAACCRLSTALSTRTKHASSSSQHGLTISCAEAFNTLKQHPAFERASQDIGEWLPRLTTITGDLHTGVKHRSPVRPPLPASSPASSGQGSNHTAFEIESASILGVLRFFDRRFGRES